MNITLVHENKIHILKLEHELSLWSNVNTNETVFMIEFDGILVGYISYDTSNTTITKFEVVEKYRNKGIGKIALKKFMNKALQFTNKIVVHPISESLFNWYETMGFKRVYKKKLKGVELCMDIMIYRQKKRK